jgi:PAS domain-containing protein
MVDKPDRPHPRFPPGQVPRVAEKVREQLERWDVGPGTTLVTGGARGADIIAAEAALARDASLRLVLAREPDEFASTSVALPQTDWEERFRALLGRSDVEVVDGSDGDVYARTNERIIERARAVDERPHALIVWNGEKGDGPGGTSDFVARLARVSGDERVVVIDPTPPKTSTG